MGFALPTSSIDTVPSREHVAVGFSILRSEDGGVYRVRGDPGPRGRSGVPVVGGRLLRMAIIEVNGLVKRLPSVQVGLTGCAVL